MATAADNILLAFYTLLWLTSFILYHYKNRHIDGGSAVMASYIVYCFFSFITLNDDFFDITYEHLRLFPFIYLYVMMMLALLPAIKLHCSPVTEIEDPHSKALLTHVLLSSYAFLRRYPLFCQISTVVLSVY